jgi:hypothetical protein
MNKIAVGVLRSKLTVGVAPALLAALLLIWVPFETLSTFLSSGNIMIAFLFLLAYIPEKPQRHWFGSSLILIAVAVLFYSLTTVLFRIYGAEYPGREVLVTMSNALTTSAMVMRTCVLLAAQGRGRSLLHRH